MRLRRPGSYVVLALLAAACTSGPPRVGVPAPGLDDAQAEASYRDVLKRSTASAELYSLFDTRGFFAATLQTPAFREARARREAAFRSETPEELGARLSRERAEEAEAHAWFVGVNVPNPAYQDLNRKSGAWRVAMVTPAGEVLPLDIERVGRSSLDLRALYPYLDTFWVGYRVRFPREVEGRPVIPPGTTEVALEIAGVPGKARLVVSAP
jgi:hypothetical protein